MYKVLIVEDEWLVRKGLRETFAWEEVECEVIGEAEDGLSALKVIEEEKPHIVFTDIRMPGMDGLRFAEELYKKYPDIQVIILTGFDDFAYAQNAMRVGVKDFLLKPTNPDEIKIAVQRIVTHLNEQSKIKQIAVRSQQQIDNGKQLLIEKLLYDKMLGYGLEQESELILELEEALLHYSLRTVLIYMDATQLNNTEAVNKICKKVAPFMPFGKYMPPVRFGENQVALIINGERVQAEKEIQTILECLDEYKQLRYHIGISQPYKNLIEISNAYEEAKQALYYTLIPDAPNIVWLDDEGKELHNVSSLTSLEHLVELIKWGTKESIIQETKYWYSSLVYKCGSDEIEIRKQFIRDIVSIYTMLIKYSDVHAQSNNIDFIRNYFQYNETLDQWLERYINSLLQWNQAFIEMSGVKQESEFEKVLEYLNEFYMKPITLQKLAQQYSMSEGHFSRLFKRHVGISFMDYITGLRIEKSKEHLANPRLRIYEAALNVGYEDSRYFSQLFKKYTGEKPTEFRKRLGIFVDAL